MKVATLAALASMVLPAHAHNVQVFDHGRRLAPMADPAYDTCSRQIAFVRSRRDRRIVAELAGCWRELENFTDRTLTVRWR
jgi:hypothetical protein